MPESEYDARSKEQQKVWDKAWRYERAHNFTGAPSKARGKARRRRANSR